ncbi:hypothetical protein BFJ68_g18363 [Fusarium oxysporum]|uniref:Uncharacterized protein n=1 Tax=Fusarium oxysporum TaxID=5507 RepID=A0A420MSK1_FUSOX|nr:hypothetical protein BFJ68_g18363 [Fusarium oxysporum]
MWDKAVFDEVQRLLALVTIGHSAAIHFKQPKGRERNTAPFIWLLVTLILLWVVEWIYMTVRVDKIIHDDDALLVATPPFFVLVLQLNAILTLPSKKGAGKEMAWQSYPVSWFFMILSNTLVVVKNVQEIQPKTTLNYAHILSIPIVRYHAVPTYRQYPPTGKQKKSFPIQTAIFQPPHRESPNIGITN